LKEDEMLSLNKNSKQINGSSPSFSTFKVDNEASQSMQVFSEGLFVQKSEIMLKPDFKKM
jgi:hypothetical protein